MFKKTSKYLHAVTVFLLMLVTGPIMLYGIVPNTSTKFNPTEFDMSSYFHTIYAHPEVIGFSDKYTPSVISHNNFIDTIDASIALNKDILRATHDGIKPAGILVDGWLPENAPFIAKAIFPINTKIIFFGDLHGSIHALIRCLEKLMNDGILDENLHILDPNVRIIFLGDLIDYGIYGIDTLFTVLQLQLRNPDKVFICRGNHESIGAMRNSFFKEYNARFGSEAYRFLEASSLWWITFGVKMADLCSLFPLAIFIGIKGKSEDGYVQCCHGGIEEGAQEDIRRLLNFNDHIVFLNMKTCFQGHCCNFNWGDVSGKDVLTQQERYPRTPGNRSSNHCKCHTIKEVQQFADDLNIKMLVRGHQDLSNTFKITLPGIDYPIYPLLRPETLIEYYSNDDKKIFDRIEFDRMALFPYSDCLWSNGFTPYDFKDIFNILPVVTFSNAYAPKKLDDQGFGLMTISQSWERSSMKVYIHEVEIASRYETVKVNTSDDSSIVLY